MADGIVFDKDGTLFDFRRTWTGWAERMLEALACGDPSVEAAASEAMGFDRVAGFARSSVVIAGTSKEVADALARATGLPAPEVESLANRIAAETPQYPVSGLAGTLDQLAAGSRLGLVTNDGERAARRHLSDAGVLERFAFVAGYDSGFGAKPEPGPLIAFAEATGLSPDRILMVGDSRHDLLAGRAAGIRTVGVLTGMAEAEDLVDLADIVLPDITHLPGWIGN